MSNYKIRVANEAESREAQELFFELGYEWHGRGKNVSYLSEVGNFNCLVARRLSGYPYSVIQMGNGKEDCQEITLPQLHDLVVLKRNKVEDATHTTQFNDSYYLDSNNDAWHFSESSAKWCKTLNSKKWLTNCLKPIKEQQVESHDIEQQVEQHAQEMVKLVKPRLYLDPTRNYEEIEWDGTFFKPEYFIEVPQGAEVAFKSFTHQDPKQICFARHYGDQVFVKSPNDFDFDKTGWASWVSLLNKVDVVWQRNAQPEPFDTPESVANDEKIEIAGTIESGPDFESHLSGVDVTLAERQSQYGSFEDVAMVTESIVAAMRKCNYDSMPPNMRMSLYMIASKMARIVNGNSNYIESWHDISGYAKLMENELMGIDGSTNSRLVYQKVINGKLEDI